MVPEMTLSFKKTVLFSFLPCRIELSYIYTTNVSCGCKQVGYYAVTKPCLFQDKLTHIGLYI